MSTEREQLKMIIKDQVFLQGDQGFIEGTFVGSWIFDFRKIILNPQHLSLLTHQLSHCIDKYERVQIGGLESTAIPVITSLILHAHRKGKIVNGFYIRKSRKKSGLCKIVEGVMNDDPIVLIDDIVNSGSSLLKQVIVLEEQGKKVSAIYTIIQYRDSSQYKFLSDKGIELRSIFKLSDFGLTLPEKQQIDYTPYQKRWIFTPSWRNHHLVAPRSTPVIYKNNVLFGADDGYFRSLDKISGALRWHIRMGPPSQGKSIFSAPAVSEEMVYFGSYDGKCYALEANSGIAVWTFGGCDWIGSSPALYPAKKLLFIGLEHAHPTQKGSLVALDMITGERRWEYSMPALTHASPLVISQYSQVCIGGNEGRLYLFDADTGQLLWRFDTEGGQKYVGVGGFSPGDIKLAPVYDSETDTIAFSSMDGHVYVVRRSTGMLVYRLHTEYADTGVKIGIFSSPLFHGPYLLFGALDKMVYCYNKKTGALVWKNKTSGRIFASPVVKENIVYIGSNDGSIYEISLQEGILLAKRQFPERVVCPVIFDNGDGGDTMYVMCHGSQLFVVEAPR